MPENPNIVVLICSGRTRTGVINANKPHHNLEKPLINPCNAARFSDGKDS